MKNLLFICLVSIILFPSCSKEKTPDLIGQWELKLKQTEDGTNTVVDAENRQGSNILLYYYLEHGFEFFEDEKFTVFQISESGELQPYQSYYETFTYELSDDYIHFNQGNNNHRKMAFEFISQDVIKMTFLSSPSAYDQATKLYFKRIQ